MSYTDDEDLIDSPDGLAGEDGEEMDISFDDAPPQDKAAVVAKAVKAVKPKPAAAPKAAASPKPKTVRKQTVAKTAATPAKSRKQHRVDTIDNNKLAAYLDRITNDEGYTLLDVSGSTSIMGSFTIVSVKG